jgi:hypothetical protein
MVIRRLRSVCVYQVQQILISWQFTTPWGTIVAGLKEEGKIKLVAEGNVLEIYLTLTPANMDIGCPPPQLAQEIFDFCGIEQREHYMVFYHILVQKDVRIIEENLKEQDIPDDIPELPAEVVPQPPAEVAENNWITADHDDFDESKANDSAQAEVDDPVELSSPPPGDETSSEPISLPTYETNWGKVPSATKATESPPDRNAGKYGLAFLSSPISTMGGGRNYDTDREQRIFVAELEVCSSQYYVSW